QEATHTLLSPGAVSTAGSSSTSVPGIRRHRRVSYVVPDQVFVGRVVPVTAQRPQAGATPVFPMGRSPFGGKRQNCHPERTRLLLTPGGPWCFCPPGSKPWRNGRAAGCVRSSAGRPRYSG